VENWQVDTSTKEQHLRPDNDRVISATYNAADSGKGAGAMYDHPKQTLMVIEAKLSTAQYGFRMGRSCEDCILAATKSMERMKQASELAAVVALDIKGAFDHILWAHIIQQVVVYEVPEYMVAMYKSYLYERLVQYGTSERSIKRGCPQGSVVGPILWTIGYNFVLEEIYKRWTR
jgi:retron-type reverse transcriptase